jgi:hypothetical protein
VSGFGCEHPDPSPSGGGEGLDGRFEGTMYSPRIGSISQPFISASALAKRRQVRASSGFGFGRATRGVLDDVGVRFGGSEHHRI